MRQHTARRRWLAAPVAALVCGAVALGLAGCGDSGAEVAVAADGGTATTGGTATSTTSTVDAEQAQLNFAACMRENGVDMPDPEPDEQGNLRIQPPRGAAGDREASREAMEACREHLAGVRPELSEEQRQEMEDRQLEFAKCMREKGVDMPDPTPGGGPGSGQRIDPSDPATAKALESCQEQLGDEGGRPGGFGGPPGGGAPPGGSGASSGSAS